MEPTILAQDLADFIKDLDRSLEWLKSLGIQHNRGSMGIEKLSRPSTNIGSRENWRSYLLSCRLSNTARRSLNLLIS